jgi:hypothetical protein
VTQTSNNQPGALSARTIKALCGVLHDAHALRDSGLALFEAFDSIDLMAIDLMAIDLMAIDLMAISDASVLDAAVKKVGRVQVMADRIREELARALPRNAVTKKVSGQGISSGNCYDEEAVKVISGPRIRHSCCVASVS